ncbi:MAG TPA: hypothetical protein P5509_08260, partial [Bacteroidales bacterium]|nr:hypothetical protein [Bacteroidales bacterium]
ESYFNSNQYMKPCDCCKGTGYYDYVVSREMRNLQIIKKSFSMQLMIGIGKNGNSRAKAEAERRMGA